MVSSLMHDPAVWSGPGSLVRSRNLVLNWSRGLVDVRCGERLGMRAKDGARMHIPALTNSAPGLAGPAVPKQNAGATFPASEQLSLTLVGVFDLAGDGQINSRSALDGGDGTLLLPSHAIDLPTWTHPALWHDTNSQSLSTQCRPPAGWDQFLRVAPPRWGQGCAR